MRMKTALALLAAQMAVASQMDDVFYVPKRNNSEREQNNRKAIKSNTQKRELREFRIKGEVIMAYSKKDAIKRMNHRK